MKIQDNYNTPEKAWGDILAFIPQDKKLWLPFYNDGTAKKMLNKLGRLNVYHENKDFFTYEPEHWDCIVDNPPYSIKQQVINKCIELAKPSALLLPLETLERKFFAEMVKNNDFTLIIPKKRYIWREGSHTPPFKCCWFCFNFKFDEQIIWL